MRLLHRIAAQFPERAILVKRSLTKEKPFPTQCVLGVPRKHQLRQTAQNPSPVSVRNDKKCLFYHSPLNAAAQVAFRWREPGSLAGHSRPDPIWLAGHHHARASPAPAISMDTIPRWVRRRMVRVPRRAREWGSLPSDRRLEQILSGLFDSMARSNAREIPLHFPRQHAAQGFRFPTPRVGFQPNLCRASGSEFLRAAEIPYSSSDTTRERTRGPAPLENR